MRTTLDIDDDVLAVATARGAQDRVSVGTALSMLAREALRHPVGIRYEDAIPVFDIPDDSREVTNEMVREALTGP
jgi:hypothetical protein